MANKISLKNAHNKTTKRSVVVSTLLFYCIQNHSAF